MTKSLGHCTEGDGKASILTQLQHNKQTAAENYAEISFLERQQSENQQKEESDWLSQVDVVMTQKSWPRLGR